MGKLAGASGDQVPFRRAQRQAEATRAQIPFRRAKRQADAAEAQIPFRRAKRPRSVRDARRLCSCCPQRGHSAYWGAKRARSPLGGGGKPEDLISVCSSESDLICCGRSTRDWANLGDGPAGLIAELALASDVADYVRFRAVCRPWRRCSPDRRGAPGGGLDGRFLPRRWIMLDSALIGTRCHRFLNLSTGECIRMDIPELAEHTLFALTPEGLLLLLHEPTLVVRLLNPLTRHLINLPPMTALLTPELQRIRRLGLELGKDLLVSSVGLVADASTVAVRFFCPMVLAVAKPGDESWTVVDDGCIKSTLPFAGRFYCAFPRAVMVMDVSSDQQPPQLRMAVDLSRSPVYFISMQDSFHLVDNSGELMLVHRMLRAGNDDEDDDEKYKYEVYKVDLEAGILIRVRGFNGRAVFIDGSSEPCGSFLDGTEHPCSVVDCLCYCIQGTGKLLG